MSAEGMHEMLWTGALAVVPLAAVVVLAMCVLPTRPATRHVLWLVVLLSLLSPVALWALDVPRVVALPQAAPAAGAVAPAGEGAESTAGPLAKFAGSSETSRGGANGPPVAGPAAERADIGAGTRLAQEVRRHDTGGAPPSARTWAGSLHALREWLRSVPPLHPTVWLGGSLVCSLVLLWRLRQASRLIAHGEPAPAEVQLVVRRASRDVGLAAPPRTLMVERRVSPMLLCHQARPALVIPRPLWEDLDDPGRRAVVLHELAHLRRRDHWTCWIETAIGVAYWWHPLVWWARRRIQEEADLSCDAWVVSRLPRHRRAYAEALVQTRSFISEGAARAPAGALGVATARARRFARRLSMVMAKDAAPRTTALGAMLVAATLAAGTFLTPVLACPPEEQKKPAAAAAATVAARGVQAQPAVGVRVIESAVAPLETRQRGQGDVLAAPAARTTTAYRVQQAQPDLEARMRRLEAQMHELTVRLGQEPAPQRAPHAPPAVAAPPSPAALPGDPVERTYRLSSGKRDALWTLMARPDVPVLVRRQGEGITVIGTAQQQRIFDEFVRLIDPQAAGGREAHEPHSHRAAPGGAAVPSSPHQQAQRTYEQALLAQEFAVRGAEERLRHSAEATRQLAEQHRRRAEVEAQRQRHEHDIEALARRADEIVRQAEVFARQAEQLDAQASEQGDERRADALRERAESLRERVEDLRERVEELREEIKGRTEEVEKIREERSALDAGRRSATLTSAAAPSGAASLKARSLNESCASADTSCTTSTGQRAKQPELQ